MRLTWFGHSCFLLESELMDMSVFIDPFSGIGLPEPRGFKPDIGLSTHSHFDHNAFGKIRCKKLFHEAKGELDSAIPIKGFEFNHDEMKGRKRGKVVAYSIDLDGLRIVHLGDLGHTLGKDDVAAFGKVDVLLVPAGGVFTLDAAGAIDVIGKLSPSVAIPMHYKFEGVSLEIDTIDPFLEQVKKSLPAAVVKIERSNSVFLMKGTLQEGQIAVTLMSEEFPPFLPLKEMLSEKNDAKPVEKGKESDPAPVQPQAPVPPRERAPKIVPTKSLFHDGSELFLALPEPLPIGGDFPTSAPDSPEGLSPLAIPPELTGLLENEMIPPSRPPPPAPMQAPDRPDDPDPALISSAPPAPLPAGQSDNGTAERKPARIKIKPKPRESFDYTLPGDVDKKVVPSENGEGMDHPGPSEAPPPIPPPEPIEPGMAPPPDTVEGDSPAFPPRRPPTPDE